MLEALKKVVEAPIEALGPGSKPSDESWAHATVRKVISLFTLAISEMICFAATVFLSGKHLACGISWNQPPDSHKKHRPILLIHGYMHDHSGWKYLRHQLHEEGFGPTYTINLGHPLQGIHDYAEQVQRRVEKIKAEHDGVSPVLIGHSMGGVVASYYNEYLAPEGGASDVITLGSPLQGTYAAMIGVGLCARELERNSPLTTDLSARISKNQHEVDYFHIACRIDQLIIPYHSALVGDDPEKHRVLDDHGHIGLLYSGQVKQQIIVWLHQIVD